MSDASASWKFETKQIHSGAAPDPGVEVVREAVASGAGTPVAGRSWMSESEGATRESFHETGNPGASSRSP